MKKILFLVMGLAFLQSALFAKDTKIGPSPLVPLFKCTPIFAQVPEPEDAPKFVYVMIGFDGMLTGKDTMEAELLVLGNPPDKDGDALPYVARGFKATMSKDHATIRVTGSLGSDSDKVDVTFKSGEEQQVVTVPYDQHAYSMNCLSLLN